MQLNHLHLQITRSCNLACSFCGQEHDAQGELDLARWFKVLDGAAQLAPRPKITIWGGEPLVSPDFRQITERAAALGFELELITNGTRIDEYADLISKSFARVYVSTDGPAEVHDSIRGKGVFAAIQRNLPMIAGGSCEIIMMGVLSPETMSQAHKAPYGMPVDRIIFHELIYLAEDELEKGGELWKNNFAENYREMLAETLSRLRQQDFPVPAEFQPHGIEPLCRQINNHLHISSTGETSFCTDFTETSLGNVQEMSLMEIFTGKAAAEQRKKVEAGEYPYCRHCAWRNTPDTIVKLGKVK